MPMTCGSSALPVARRDEPAPAGSAPSSSAAAALAEHDRACAVVERRRVARPSSASCWAGAGQARRASPRSCRRGCSRRARRSAPGSLRVGRDLDRADLLGQAARSRRRGGRVLVRAQREGVDLLPRQLVSGRRRSAPCASCRHRRRRASRAGFRRARPPPAHMVSSMSTGSAGAMKRARRPSSAPSQSADIDSTPGGEADGR